MYDKKEIIKKAYILLKDDSFVTKYSSTIMLSNFKGVDDNQYEKAKYLFKAIRQDFTKIMVTMNSIDRAYKWYQKDEYPNTYHDLYDSQATNEIGCLIEYLFAKYRVILEYLSQLLEIFIPPILNDTEKETYYKNKKNSFDYLIKYITDKSKPDFGLMNTEWFQNLRKTRNVIIHAGASCLVFGDKKNLLFQVYSPDSVDKDDESVELDAFYSTDNGLVYYDRYWGLYFSELIVFCSFVFDYIESIGTLTEENKSTINILKLYKDDVFIDYETGTTLTDIKTIPTELLKSLYELS